MSLVVNSNIAGLNSARVLGIADRQQSTSIERLSSGLRINRAADDAASLGIAEGLRTQIGGFKVALRNSQDGISVLQTAEGALTETHSLLHRMRDLAVQAANTGGLDDAARANVQTEIGQLRAELDRIAETTSFNGRTLLDGSYRGTFQVGADAGHTITVGFGPAMSAAGLGLAGVDVTAAGTGGTTASSATTAAVGTASSITLGTATLAAADFDSLSGSVSHDGRTLDLGSLRFGPSDTATEKLAQIDAALTTTFGAGSVTATNSGGLVLTGTAPPPGASARDLADATVLFSPATGATRALEAIDAAIGQVSTARAELGAAQNRFEHNIAKLGVALDNTAASESRIRDADIAAEMSTATRASILTQAGTAMAAQANQTPRGVLQLLV
ncbi:flagellin N-terminal helical domain-containing protein [Modestobacter sp. VKM Ac-2985]|uniref:flagellin N-terminal helical domain-containing protein n=1 Tax=Modestobacter sp. VKM Ac-2985 TaxID=3004139 RepID=UPI0022AB644F|nr:flagellin [Modestobacter sp. VKM Ac-2985]MCZ2836518.1 flagellin [Modestobacter sp. VKM Ac-2985]